LGVREGPTFQTVLFQLPAEVAGLGTDRYLEALEGHRTLLRAAFERYDGYEFETDGDAFFLAFVRADG
jgi:hypothetical protein